MKRVCCDCDQLPRLIGMKTKIVHMGKSGSVRNPKSFLEEAQLGDEVQLRLLESGILIEPAGRPRADRSDAAALFCEQRQIGMLDAPTSTDFERASWLWE